jgi:hydroxypyruvate isomerase
VGPITIVDFSSAWVMKDLFQVARSKPGWMSREDVLKFYSELKVDGVELMHDYWHDCSASQLRSLTGDLGLPITCYVFFADLAVNDGARQANVDEGRKLLDRTAEIGTSRAMVVPAVFKPELPLADQRRWIVNGLRALAEHAQSVGVNMLAENIDYAPVRPFMGRGEQCRHICAEVDSPAFRLIYDAGCSLAVQEDPVETLHVMAPYLGHVHVKNLRYSEAGEEPERFTKSNTGELLVATPLNKGLVDMDRVLAELERLGYAGPILLEYQGEDPLTTLPLDVAYLRRIQSSALARA